MSIQIVILLCAAFCFAGFVDSIAGGGGLISIPAFLLTGVQPEVVLGTNKLAASLGTTSSLLLYARSGLVLWRVAVLGLPAALLGAFLGSKTILLFDSVSIGRVMVFLLPLGMAATLLPKKERAISRDLTSRDVLLTAPLLCLILGFYDGFFGPGTGSFFIIAFNLLMGIGLVQASATTKIFNLATSFSGFCVFAFSGHVLYALALPLALCNIVGNLLGSRLAIRIGAAFVRKMLLFSLSVLFISLIVKFFIAA